MASTHHHQTRSLQLVQLPPSGHGLMATPMTPILTGIPPCSCGRDCRTCCNFCLLAQTRRCVYTMKRLCSRKSQLPRLPSIMTVYSSIDAIVLCTVTCCTTEELRYRLGPRCFSHKFHTEYAVEACSRITPETSLYAQSSQLCRNLGLWGPWGRAACRFILRCVWFVCAGRLWCHFYH